MLGSRNRVLPNYESRQSQKDTDRFYSSISISDSACKLFTSCEQCDRSCMNYTLQTSSLVHPRRIYLILPYFLSLLSSHTFFFLIEPFIFYLVKSHPAPFVHCKEKETRNQTNKRKKERILKNMIN